VLDPSLSISGVLNDVLVSSFPGLESLPTPITHSGHILFSPSMFQSAAVMVVFPVSVIFSVKCPVLSSCSLSLKIPSSSSMSCVLCTDVSF